MARALRLRIEYKDINEVDTQVNVYSEGFSGQYGQAPADGDPLSISWGDESSKMLPGHYGSSAKVRFDAETDYQYLDLFSSDARANLVEVKKAGSIFWLGFMDSEDLSEPLIAPPYPVSIKAYDGIGLLKDEPFLQADGSSYQGETTLLEILQICLAKTGHGLDFNTAVSFRGSGQPSTADSLSQHKKDVVVYQDMSCYEVLGQILPACRIFQRGGEWYVISNDNWGKPSIPTYRYNYNGVGLGAGSFDPVSPQGWWSEGVSKLKTMPALKHMDVEQDYGHKSNLFDNGDFTDGLNGWTTIGLGAFTPVVKTLTDKDENYVYLPGQETLQLPPTKYLKATLPVQQSLDPTKLTLGYAAYGDGDGAHLFIRVKVTGISQTYHLRQYGDHAIDEVVYSWTTNGADERTRILMNFHYTDFTRKYPDGINPNRVRSVSWENLSESFRDFKAIIPSLPVTGSLEIQLCIAQTNDHNIQGGACFKNVDIDILNEEQEEVATGKAIRLTNNNKNNFTPDELKFVNGDLPQINNNKLVYQGGFLLADGTPTANWKVDGLTGTYTFTELVARLLASSMRHPRQAYTGRFADFVPGMDMVIVDPNNNNKKFIEAGITYNDRMQTVEGRYIEVVADDLTGFTVSEIPGDTSGGSTGRRGSGKDYNDAVAIYSHETLKELSPPTFLSSKYFEVEPNEIGSPLIVPKTRLINQNFILDDVDPTVEPLTTGNNATAIGEGVTADVYRMLALGSFNETATGSAENWAATDPLLMIGNGTDTNNRSNALTIYKSGYTDLQNALKIGAFSWGANSPGDGALQYTATDGFQAYTNAAWNKLTFIDPAAENTRLVYYDAVGLALKTSMVAYTDLEDHLADIAAYSVKNINALAGQVIGTFTSDAKGHVTGISLRSLVAGDIPDLSALYAGTNHNHDLLYAAIGHDHDSDYAPVNHNHDSLYAPLSHSHNYMDRWILKTPDAPGVVVRDSQSVHFAGSGGIDISRSHHTVTIDGSAIGGGTTYTEGTAIDIVGSAIHVDLSELQTNAGATTNDFIPWMTTPGVHYKMRLSTLQSLIGGGGGATYTAGNLIDIIGSAIHVDLSELSTSSAAGTSDFIPWTSSSGAQSKMLISTLQGLIGGGGGTPTFGDGWTISGSGGFLYFRRNGVTEFQIGTAGVYTDGSIQGFSIQDLG